LLRIHPPAALFLAFYAAISDALRLMR